MIIKIILIIFWIESNLLLLLLLQYTVMHLGTIPCKPDAFVFTNNHLYFIRKGRSWNQP